MKETASQISKPLTTLFNQSTKDSIISNEWKLGNAMPIHKAGSKHLVSNYRPISLTSILAKLMEIEIRDSITKHMESNKLFTNHQHGFRNGRSCQTKLLEVLEDWTSQIDEKNNMDIIYLNFQNAFDTVITRNSIRL